MTQMSRPALVCHGHTRPIPELNFSYNTPDGHFLVSACKDGKAMLRRGDTGDWVGTFDGHGNACVWSCALNQSALLAATASADFTCKLWNAVSGEELQSWQHGHIVRSVHFSMHNNKLVTACHDKCVRIFDVANISAPPMEISGLAEDTLRCAKFLRNSTTLLASYANRSGLDVLDSRSGKRIGSIATSAPVTSIEIGYDGLTATIASGTEIGIYDGDTMRMFQRIEALQQVESASLCVQKKLLVVGGQDMWAYMLEYPSGKPVMVHKGHFGPIWSIQFSHDGESFASASEDGTVRIWCTNNKV
jgi:serine-threonine kinase receptor-associated protein